MSKSVKLMLMSITAGIVGGLAFGLVLGILSPQFCIALFGDHPMPIESGTGLRLGLGLGLANGAWFGLIGGVALVIADALKSSRRDSDHQN